MVRKSELQDAVWDEIDFENAVWTIPKERMRRSKTHNVCLSRQALGIFIAFKTCAGNSRYVLPSRYDADAPMSRATFNLVTYLFVGQAPDGIDAAQRARLQQRLDREVPRSRGRRSSRGVYNKAEYEMQRRHMLQEWSNTVDAWVAGQKYAPVFMLPSMPLF